jgi:hypothetical protein
MPKRRKIRSEFLNFVFNLENLIRKKRNLKIEFLLRNYIIAAAIFGCFLALMTAFDVRSGSAEAFKTFLGAYFNPLTLFIYVLAFAVVYLYLIGGVLHVLIRVLGGKGKFDDTLNVVGISTIPTLLFGWAPIIDFWAFIYAICLFSIGVSAKHKIPLAFSTIIVALMIIWFVLISLFFGMPFTFYAV